MKDEKPIPQRKNSGRKLSSDRGSGGTGGSGLGTADGETTAARRKQRLAGIRPRISIEELRNAFKRQASVPQDDTECVFDPMAKAQESKTVIRGRTGVVYDEAMAKHKCPWDDAYPECPDRLLSCLDRCKELQLLNRCEKLESRKATEEEIAKLHSRSVIDLLRYTQKEDNEEAFETLSSHYNSVYFSPHTYEAAMLAAGNTLVLVDNIASGKVQNGMALVRPPGHHAMKAEYCGYCFFNNVALGTQRALEKHNMSRVLIVDWDVHHGQATQQMFYEDPRVLYFSIHRYEHGSFWPELRESEYTYIGSGPGRGFNFNLPLNQTGMKNEDYLAVFHQVLLPVAYEFNPELILISCGYDAAVGCPEFAPELVLVSAGFDSALGDRKGEMEVTPAFYAHLTSSLMALAQGKVAVVLEGGYCLESTAEGASKTLSALLYDPCPMLMDPLGKPSQSIQESILNLIYAQRPYWKCFQYQSSFSVNEEVAISKHVPSVTYRGNESISVTYPTRSIYPFHSAIKLEEIAIRLKTLKGKENIQHLPSHKLCLVYDEEMSKHKNTLEKEHPERPERTERIWRFLNEFGVTERSLVLESRRATREEIEAVHTRDHVDLMFSLNTLSNENIRNLQETYKSVYLHPSSNDAALLSSGSLLQVVDSVCSGESQSGIGVIRPPGHHAEMDHPHGFCLYNNVAVATKYAAQKYGYQRILVLDWDVHHGNGIQHAFESDPSVLYVSIHRYDDGLFFPSSEDANYDRVGVGRGEGFNVNIPWNKSGMGDAEYMSAMLQVVMPIAYQFDPQLVIVSAGFDAARGDPLGGCRVTPECYGHMTHLLTSLAGGRIILALEGGYNLNVISYCMTMCAKALLGDPTPALDKALVPNKRAVETISSVIQVHSKYWSSLCFQVALPVEDVLSQGFGGMPQAVESGMSGSEVSSCNPSPVSTPSVSPIYVSAPSSPDKIWKEKQLVNSFKERSSMSCEAEFCSDRVNSPTEEPQESLQSSGCSDSLGSSLSVYTTPVPTPEKISPAKAKGLSPKDCDTSGKLQTPVMRGKTKKGNSSTPNRLQKPRKKQSDVLMVAASSIAHEKKYTSVVFGESCGAGCKSETLQNIRTHLQEFQLLETCNIIPSREARKEEFSVLFNDGIGEERMSEEEKDRVLTSVGNAVDMISEVVFYRCQNGIVLVPCGNADTGTFSLCDIASFSAKHTIDNLNVQRVMIVDLDCSTNRDCHAFCGDKRILTFCLRLHGNQQCQSSGKESTKGCESCDRNIKLNLGCQNFHMENYYTLFHQLILPVAYEFAPEVIVVVSNYEAAAHCANVFPVVYAHLVGQLMALANGRIVALSGTSQHEAVTKECISAVFSALQDIPCSSAPKVMESASPLAKAEVLEVINTKRNDWKTLQCHAQTSCALSYSRKPDDSTQECCGRDSVSDFKRYAKSSVDEAELPLCLVYDESMLEHFSYEDRTHPECPDRIRCIYQRLQEFRIVERCLRVKARPAFVRELEELHSPKHLRLMSSLVSKKPSDLQNLQENYESVFFHRQTHNAALMAAGSVNAVVDSVLKGESRRALAVIRPPGHHAERNEPCGFCFFNNVAVGAKHAINEYGLKRILILDWDVHHGNGIQHMFESDPRVLYISIHRYDNGRFFPCSTDANYNRVGIKKGKGFNINIPWNKGSMSDGDYIAAVTQIVLPVAFEFNPQLVLVSAGFDAAIGDPLGGCQVTPECYGHMTKLLMQLAEGKVVIALEGGYNLNTISYCMTMCAKALLGDPIPSLPEGLAPSESAVESLSNVISAHKKFWPSLDLKNTLGLSPGNSHSPSSPASESGRRTSKGDKAADNAVTSSVDELSANLCGVTLEDKVDKAEKSPLNSENNIEMKGEPSSSRASEGNAGESTENDLEGAVGGTSGQQEDGVNTFLLTEVPGAEQMYAVVPKTWCPHLEQIKDVPSAGLKTDAPCDECHDRSENWVCLTCYKVLCGRFVNEHMLMHGVSEEHFMVLSFADLSVWCYACESYIHHDSLREAKRAAHFDKFGEDIPGST
ncbi:uncharacterized protein LOC135205071 isoform X2 [Macrobrachium nipponense]|uniref:uncharacterized protein LOC135205071 isoform X2 n=1 Tax=Macrobrachium nipponense TaxID=159736 RepID=UPI0030C88AF6